MNSDRKLTISILVVTKDRPQRIGDLFEALSLQSLAPDEVVVVDNNSRLSYQEVFEAYTERLPLRTFVERTPGIPSARNRAIQESRCDLILFTDDDCVPDPDWVEKMVEPFYRDPHIGAVGGRTTFNGATGTLVEQYYRADREAIRQ